MDLGEGVHSYERGTPVCGGAVLKCFGHQNNQTTAKTDDGGPNIRTPDFHFEPSLDASNLRSEVISSIVHVATQCDIVAWVVKKSDNKSHDNDRTLSS